MTQDKIVEGQEDRHGEMTGAITVNMALSMIPVGAWCFFLGPWLCSFPVTLTVGVLMAVILPLVCQPLSRKIWGWLCDWVEQMQM